MTTSARHNFIEHLRTAGKVNQPIKTIFSNQSNSSLHLVNRFSWEEAQIDVSERYLAQQYARFARHCSPEVAEKMMNRANAHLAGAMQLGGNAEFWEEVVG